jgi:hypothetical protein
VYYSYLTVTESPPLPVSLGYRLKDTQAFCDYSVEAVGRGNSISSIHLHLTIREPPWNFIFLSSALNKSDAARVYREILLT